MFDKQRNPYYRLLMGGQASRRKDRQKRRTRWIQGFIVFAALPLIFNEIFWLSCGCSLIMLLFPVVAAVTFAQTSAIQSRSADYELITTTPLPDDDIVWGQFYSTLDRALLSRQIPYGLIPAAFGLIMLGLSLAFVVEESSEWQSIPAIACMIISFAGVYWLLSFTGIALGLAIRRPGMASWIMAGFSFVAMSVWAAVILSLPLPEVPFAEYILFALFPYIPIVPAIFMAYRFARNPVISPPTT